MDINKTILDNDDQGKVPKASLNITSHSFPIQKIL